MGDTQNGEHPPTPQPQQLPAPCSRPLGLPQTAGLGHTGSPQSLGNRPHLNSSRAWNTPYTRESQGSPFIQSCKTQRDKGRVGSGQGHGTTLPPPQGTGSAARPGQTLPHHPHGSPKAPLKGPCSSATATQHQHPRVPPAQDTAPEAHVKPRDHRASGETSLMAQPKTPLCDCPSYKHSPAGSASPPALRRAQSCRSRPQPGWHS